MLVEGIDNCLVKFARCCTPVPGDEIVGFITRGNGVSVHCRECTNFVNVPLDEQNGGRWIPVSWADDTSGEKYQCTIHITSAQRSGLVMDIATALNSINAVVHSINARDLMSHGLSVATITVEVKNSDELRTIMNRLSGIRGVVEMLRAGRRSNIRRLNPGKKEETV